MAELISEGKTDPKAIAERLVQVTRFSVEAHSSFRGPLPPPEDLAKYEHTLPGAAERIFGMAESQASHRQSLEKSVVEEGQSRSNKGLWLGFIISLVVLAIGATFVLTGHDWAGVSLLSATLVRLAAVFVIGQRGQSRERVRKEQAIQSRQTSN